ncbi:hypothetical protein ACWEQ1_17440 [Streptomyces nodosus]
MGIGPQFMFFSGSLTAILTVLFAVALAHPEPQVRTRAERLLTVIFRIR